MIPLLVFLSLLPAVTITGFVRESGSGEPIANALIELEGSELGTLSDQNGYYVLHDVPVGIAVLRFSAIGYQAQSETLLVTPDRALRHDVRLKTAPIPLHQVEVSAQRERFRRELDLGIRELKPRDMKLAPGFIEQDLFKSLQIMPGVITISDFSSALYVRGGSPDQNQILLDGVEIYNPYHLGGLFSTFTMDALSSAQLHSGGFPAQYGGAVSSVLDVELKQGNNERLSGAWDVSLLSSKAVLEGPIPKGSFLIAGRRTYIDLLTGMLRAATGESSVYLPYYFYDLQAKVNMDITPKHRLTASAFLGDDVLYFADGWSKLDFAWGNLALALKWRWLVTPNLVSTVLATRGRYRTDLRVQYREGNDTGAGRFTLGVGNWSLKQDYKWFAHPNHTVLFGWEAKPLEIQDLLVQDTVRLLDLHERPFYSGLYFSDQWRPSPTLSLDFGIRGEYFSGGRYLRVVPRLGAKHLLNEDLALKAGYGHYYQYMSIPFPRDELMMKMPVFMFQQWLPASKSYPPVYATHYTLGAEWSPTPGKNWGRWLDNISLEGYYKTMKNLLESDMAFSFGQDSIAFSRGTGWATGAELLLRRRNSWLGYSLAFTRRTFDGVSFWPVFDTRHTMNVAWGIPLPKDWNLSLQWVYHSGFPYTGYVGRYVHFGPDWPDDYAYWRYVEGRRGGYRYPDYHRLDAAIEKSFRLLGANWTIYLQVVNCYFQKNVLFYNYYTDEQGRYRREPFYMIPFPIPSLGLKGNF